VYILTEVLKYFNVEYIIFGKHLTIYIIFIYIVVIFLTGGSCLNHVGVVVIVMIWCWIYNYLCNRCLSPLKLCVWISFMARCTRYNFMWWRLSMTCGCLVFFPVSSTNKTDHHDIPEILLSGVKRYRFPPPIKLTATI